MSMSPPVPPQDEDQPVLGATPIEEFPMTIRPGFVTCGRPVPICCNHYQVNTRTKNIIIHYDVDLLDVNMADIPSAKLRAIMKQLSKKEKVLSSVGVAYDGRKNIYAHPPIEGIEEDGEQVFEFETEYDDEVGLRKELFKIKIHRVASLPIDELQELFKQNIAFRDDKVHRTITALDTVLRTAGGMRFKLVGNSLFDSTRASPISGGVDLWPGFYQSLRAGQCGLHLCVNTVTSAFIRPEAAMDYIRREMNCSESELCRQLHGRRLHRMSKCVKGLQVKVTHRDVKRKYKVIGVSDVPASKLEFPTDDEGHVSTVARYFAEKYNPLKLPDMYCLKVGSKKRPVYLPPEVCHIVGGSRVNKLSDAQAAEIIRFSARHPWARRKETHDCLTANIDVYNNLGAKFGLRVESPQIEVEGRVLEMPAVQYNSSCSNSIEMPKNGTWNLVGKKFAIGKDLVCWAVVNFCHERDMPQPAMQRFVSELVKVAEAHGILVKMRQPPILNYRGSTRATLTEANKQALRQSRDGQNQKIAQYIFCIIPNGCKDEYRDIKCEADTILGMRTQCVTLKHAREPRPQVLANILLKTNAKLGGVNSVVKGGLPWLNNAPTMIVGADVHHPAPGSFRPSIAACAASMDRHCFQHMAVGRVQASRQEFIEDLCGMMKDLLRGFYANCKTKPQRILFLRDGISEGQFKIVMAQELQAIERACGELERDYRPKISFISCQKRHHTRLFAINERDEDRSGNAPAGLVVDRGITHPINFDFYLLAHSGIQGCSRPCKYHVVHDENNISADDLYKLLFSLSFMYARCTRSVSLPPPVYYSHLLAFRMAYFVKEDDSSEEMSVMSRMSDKDFPAIDYTDKFTPPVEGHAKCMFWI